MGVEFALGFGFNPVFGIIGYRWQVMDACPLQHQHRRWYGVGINVLGVFVSVGVARG